MMETKEESQPTYKRKTGEISVTGMNYEDKVASLLCLRATIRGYHFHLATGVEDAGKFDDIVFNYSGRGINKTVFIQLKHKDNIESKQDFDKFFTVKEKKKSFSLKQYFDSFYEMKTLCEGGYELPWWGKFENFQFVLFSNVKYEHKYLTQVEVCENDILNTGGCVYRLNEKAKNILKIDNTVDTDNDLIQEFCQKFILYINQKSESEISCIIKNEIFEKYKLSFCRASEIERRIVSGLGNLRSEKEHCPVITEKHNFYSKECGQDIITNINEKELKINFSIQLEDGVAKRFKENLENSKHNVIVIQNSAPVWCSLLAHQTLTDFGDHPVIVRLQKLVEDEIIKQTNTVWPSDWCKYLIIVVINDDKEVLHSKMVNLIRNSTNECKIILVTDSLETVSLEKIRYDTVELPCNFRHLTGHSKNTVLQKEVNFQGDFPVKLKDLLQEGEAENILNSVLLNKLILYPGAVQIGESIKPQMNYISRKVVHCAHVSTDVLQEQSNDIFAMSQNFEEVKYNTLAQGSLLNTQSEIQFFLPIPTLIFTKDQNPETANFIGIQKIMMTATNLLQSSKDLTEGNQYVRQSQTTNSFMGSRNIRKNVHFINGKEDYEALCRDNGNVHWLEDTGTLLKWKATSGDISVIQKHILRTGDVSDVYNVGTVYDIPGKTVLLISEPGMGKTSLLNELAYNTKVRNRSTFVVHLKLLNSILFLKNLEKDKLKMGNIDRDVIVNFLLSSCQSDCVIWRSLCHNAFLKEKKIVLLIDGFDEVIPKYEDILSNILTKIVKMNVDKIWITSRPIVKDSLEKKLKTLSCELSPFDQTDQIEFFCKQWCDEEFDKTTIISCVKRISTLDNTFLGIPLHCQIVAEVFQTYMKEQDSNIKSDLLSKVTDELYLYEAFIRKKFQKYCKKYDLYESDPETSTTIKNWEEYVTNHMHAAVLQICINNDDKICERLMKSTTVASFLEKIENGEEKTGLISFVRNSTPQFVHRKFAEFFTAKYFSQTLFQNINMVRDIMLCTDRLSFSFDLRHMLNLFLFKDLPLHRAVYNLDVAKVKEILNMHDADAIKAVDQLDRTALHIALNEHFSAYLLNIISCNEIIIELLNCKPDVNAQDKLTQRTPFQYLGPRLSWHVIKMLLQTNSVEKKHIFELIQLLWESDRSTNMIIRGRRYEVTCENETVHKFIFNHYKLENTEDVWVSRQYEALHHTVCNLNMLKYMINVLKIDKNVKDTQGNTILHEACLKGDIETVQYLVKECELDMNVRNVFDHSPVDNAVKGGHIHILKWFREERKLNIKDQMDKKGKGVLFWARDINCVQYLVEECGIDPKVCKDVSGALPIHEASRRHLWKIVDYYVEKCGVDIKVMDNSFATVLHFACLRCRSQDITDFLIKYRERLDFEKKNIHKLNPFCVAVMNGSFVVAKCIANVYDVTGQDEKGNTCLQNFILNNLFMDLWTVKFLVEDCKINPNIRNNDGKTALDIALEQYKNHMDFNIYQDVRTIRYLKNVLN